MSQRDPSPSSGSADAAPKTSRWRRASPRLAVTGLLLFAFLVGWGGIDFGHHWDEWYQMSGLKHCVERMELMLDENQSYGGPYFYLGLPVLLASTAPEIAAVFRETLTISPAAVREVMKYESVKRFQAAATSVLNSQDYLLHARTLFLAVSCLAILWIYLAMARLRPGARVFAVAAAAFVALSWQLQFHFRFLAIDGPVAQCVALQIFLLCGAMRARDRVSLSLWSIGVAAAGGATFACKMTGAFALFPTLLLPLLWPGLLAWRKRLGLLLVCAVVFLSVSYMLSPTPFLDPLHFLVTVRTGSWDYEGSNTIAQHPNYVPGFFEHLLCLVLWLYVFVPSPFRVVAVALSGVALIGAWRLARREPRLFILLVSFPVTFGLVFVRNKLMVPRQYLGFVPLMALFFGEGLAFGAERLSVPRARHVLAAVTTLCFVLNAGWALAAMSTIRHPDPSSFRAEAAKELLAHPRPIRMTERAYRAIGPQLGAAFVCAAANLTDPSVKSVLSFQEETRWFVDRFPTFRAVYSNRDVDLSWYPTWVGAMRSYRIVEVSLQELVSRGIDMRRYWDCRPEPRQSVNVPSSGVVTAAVTAQLITTRKLEVEFVR